MTKKILIVDDEIVQLETLERYFRKYRDTITVLTAQNGIEAIAQLKNHVISAMITDLMMPEMDGFELLAHVSEHFPEVPAIIITGMQLIRSQRRQIGNEVVGFIQKPISFEALHNQLTTIFKKQAEDGTLKSFKLEAFLQMVAMGQRTCTLRISDKASGQEGLMFFKRGALLEARTGNLRGKNAAYQILSWDDIVVEIQNSCPVETRRIKESLPFIILEAMERNEKDPETRDASDPIDGQSVLEGIRVAETYRNHGLHKEALTIYRDLLPHMDQLEETEKSRFKKVLSSLKNEVEGVDDSNESEVNAHLDVMEAYLASGLHDEAKKIYKEIVVNTNLSALASETKIRLMKLADQLKSALS